MDTFDTAEEAKAELALRVASDAPPALDDTHLDALLRRNRRRDPDGRPPSDEEWQPTYDLNSAAADGWEAKAGLAAGRFDIQIDSQTLTRSQIRKHCLDQAETWRQRVAYTRSG